MYSISNKISLLKQASVAKSNFSNDEIIPSAVVQFSCCDCGHEIQLKSHLMKQVFLSFSSIMKLKSYPEMNY